MSALYTLLQSVRSTSSGSGGSYWANAASCGMKGRLNDEFPTEEDEDAYDPTETPTGRKKVNGRRCGTFFHALQMFWRIGRIDGNAVVSVEHQDYDFEVAVRSFTQYRDFFLGNIHNRGRVIEAEVKYPANEEQERRLREALGDLRWSIRPDLVTEIDPVAQEAILRQSGCFAPTGRWLVDYKLCKDVAAGTVDYNTTCFQARSYAISYNICNPETPVLGTLYDMTARVVNFVGTKHNVIVPVPVREDDLMVVRDGIHEAELNKQRGAAQPMNCHGKFGRCRFLNMCPRYGKYDDFVFDINNKDYRRK